MTLRYTLLITALVVVMAVALAFFVYDRGREYHLTVAAGARDGEAFQVAEAVAEVTHLYNPRIEIEVLETQGSGQNMQLINENRVDLAAVLADTRALPAARLVALLYPDAFQLVAREGSGIQSVADLAGKKVALPPRRGGQYGSFWFLAGHYGLSESDIDALPMSADAANYAMIEGVVDAVFRVRAPGNPSIRALIENSPTHLVQIDQAAAMQLKQPALELGTIPKGSYQGHPPLPENDLPTAVVKRLLIANAELDPNVVNIITRTLFERRRDMVGMTPLAGFVTSPSPGSGTFLPVHSGAQRYFNREKPSFLQENAELLAVGLSVLLLFGSGMLQLGSQRRKRLVDVYNQRLLTLYAQVRATDSRQELLEQRDRLMSILGQVVDDAENRRISSEGFNFFTFTWEAVNEAVRDKLVVNDRGPRHAAGVDQAAESPGAEGVGRTPKGGA